MKLSVFLPLLAAAGLASAAKPAAMERLMTLKSEQREAFRSQGLFNSGKYGRDNRFHKCRGGRSGEYACNNVDMHGFLSHEEMGSTTREGNDVWGKQNVLMITRNLFSNQVVRRLDFPRRS